MTKFLQTNRLVLRPLELSDADRVAELAGDRAIADTTLRIPHPYPSGLAEKWIAEAAQEWDSGKSVSFGIHLQSPERAGQGGLSAEQGGAFSGLIGAIGLIIDRDNDRAELGYWIGRPYWGQGFATEAVNRVLSYGFEELRLHRIQANHFTRNPASGRVMEKAGMTREGTLRGHSKKGDGYEDVVLYAALAGTWRRGE